MNAEAGKRLGAEYGRELSAAILLGVAALATSWIGYQSSLWSDRQIDTLNESSTLRMESSRAAAEAMQLTAVDVGVFTNWVNAYAMGNKGLDTFYRTHFRQEFKPAYEAWMAQRPLQNPRAANSPFALPEYRLQSKELARQLVDSSEAKLRESQGQGAVKNKYVANAVVMAMALLFTGISRDFPTAGIQATLLVLAALLSLFGLFSIARLPILH